MTTAVDLGTLHPRAGDSYELGITFQGWDLSDATFVAQIRRFAESSTVLETFGVTVTTMLVVLPDTTTRTDSRLLLRLDGDSTLGVTDGQTRVIGRHSVFDIEVHPGVGDPFTIAAGKLSTTQDVTR